MKSATDVVKRKSDDVKRSNDVVKKKQTTGKTNDSEASGIVIKSQ